MSFTVTSAKRTSPVTDPIRVMVVDDSIVARNSMTRWIDEDPEMAVIASHRNGRNAVNDVERVKPDVIVLDIEMPDMDGLTALPLLLRKMPNAHIVMASTLTRRNAEISLKALSLGASDYVPKPETIKGGADNAELFRQELLNKVRQLGGRKQQTGRTSFKIDNRASAPSSGFTINTSPGQSDKKPDTAINKTGKAASAFHSVFHPKLKPWGSAIPRVLAIGSSTGGPQALAKVLGDMRGGFSKVPVLIVQHMPPMFTAIMAEHLGKVSGIPSAEAKHGDIIKPGHIYVAPGGKHMILTGTKDMPRVELQDGPPINYCKPAVDPMFQSLADIYGSSILGLILTGMGADGAVGAKSIADRGGNIIAQDESTSVVWGMPHAALEAGACAAQAKLQDIAPLALKVMNGVRP
jgi:two-component system chemotaxis response regulator CheB